MLEISKTNSENPDFIKLVKLLDAELAISDGDDHAFYDQYNKIDKIKHVVVGLLEGCPVSCGAIKEYQSGVVEIKRMYTAKAARGKGIASTILKELENWAGELGYQTCILETGINQHEALGFYPKNGYSLIDNYGQYAGVDTSRCFQKKI